MVDNKVDSMFLDQRHYDRGRLPSFIHPLAFSDYKEADILKSIAEIGWMPPDDTDANSTNCLLNSFGNEVHLRQYGFHPYAFEIAGLVRDGYMSREDGILKLNTPPNPNVLDMVKQKLGVDEIPQ